MARPDVTVRGDGTAVAFHGGRCYGIAPVGGSSRDWIVFHPVPGCVRIVGDLGAALAWVEGAERQRKRAPSG